MAGSGTRGPFSATGAHKALLVTSSYCVAAYELVGWFTTVDASEDSTNKWSTRFQEEPERETTMMPVDSKVEEKPL